MLRFIRAMKHFFFLIAPCIGICIQVHAQYYYQDVCNARNTMEEHRQYRQLGVHTVHIRSFDYSHSLNKDFHCTRDLSADFRQVTTRTSSLQTGKSVIITDYDAAGRIVSTLDSTQASVNTTRYYYDSLETTRIDSLLFDSYANNDADTFRYREKRIYRYDTSGHLTAILREKNGTPYSTVSVETDSAGNVTGEVEKGKYDSTPPVHYKYNAAGQITDIFHYNKATGKLNPDYLFDYDPSGRLLEKTVVTMNIKSYLLWKYSYNDKGLIASEACYGKKHALQGTMEFQYTY